eukprot:scaffold6444_cov79-Isochrysis_galbana.AAC.1
MGGEIRRDRTRPAARYGEMGGEIGGEIIRDRARSPSPERPGRAWRWDHHSRAEALAGVDGTGGA